MADCGEVIKGLNDIHAVACGWSDDQCFLNGIGVQQLQTLIDAATELLKAQEPVKPKFIDTSNSKLYHSNMFQNYCCGNCGEFLHIMSRNDLFCSQCGRAVKWE